MKMLNNVPVYEVNFVDFGYLISLYKEDKRFLTRNLTNADLVDYVKRTRSRDFYFEYQGVIVDFRTYGTTATQDSE